MTHLIEANDLFTSFVIFFESVGTPAELESIYELVNKEKQPVIFLMS